ncbi:hypothetical protein FMUND_9326 [Fusarium mundagurra]|uniref:CCHC-type domain-containing protein n=1 Tax=Fusarium mundagurra TaxID=1567541 RepID=A0A8H5YGD3_9HYPO|nr:hypothetical protein FMUND_9326 [Fusarium mundagurra]
MPPHDRQNKRQRDEKYVVPERPSPEDVIYLLWESSKQTSCAIAEILKVKAINQTSISTSLKNITKRLSKLESDVHRFGLPDQDMADNFDRFRHQLASIQQEFIGSDFEPGQNPVFKGTLRSCLGDLSTQMGGVTDRMVNVEDNLVKLEARLFGQFDSNINLEAGYVMVKIHEESDFLQKLKDHTYIELTRMVQSQGGVWAKVDTVKLQRARATGKFHYMIISFSDWDTGEYVRQNPQNLTELFELTHGCSTLPLTYHLHIVDLAVHQKMGYDYDMKRFVEEQLPDYNVRAKVAYQRVILQTQHLGTAKRLAVQGVHVFNHKYQAKPYCAQGTPLFCNRCCNPNHFANDCNAAKPRCGLCAGEHESFTCNLQRDFKCCNCGGAHKAWDPCCTDKLSRAEHQKSLFYRNKVPQWALNIESENPFKPDEKVNGKTKTSTQGSSSVPSSQESAKKPVGRPKKHLQPDPAGQSRITSFMERRGDQESQVEEPEPDAMELTTPPDDLEMNGIEVPSSQRDTATINESSNSIRPSSSHDDFSDFSGLFDEDMSTTGGEEEPEQSRPGSRLSESSSTPSLNDRSTTDAEGNKKQSKKGKKGKNGQDKSGRDTGKGKENATTDPKTSTQPQKKDSTTPSSSQVSPNAGARSPTGKGKAVAVEKGEDRARSSSGDLPRGQSRNKDGGGKRGNSNSDGSRDRGRSSTRSINRASSKASSRRANGDSDSDSDDGGHTKSGGSQRATNDKTRKPQQTGTPRHGNDTKSTPKAKASARTASVDNRSVSAVRTSSASRAPVGTPSKASVTTARTSSAQPPDKRSGHARSGSGREKGGPSPRRQGNKKRKFSQGSAKDKGSD